MSDEDRIAYLAGDGDVPDDAAGLDELRDLLADPSLWAEAPSDLEDRVAAAIAAEVAAGDRAAGGPAVPPASVGPAVSPASVPPASPVVAPRSPAAIPAPVRRSRPWRLLAVAAALVVVVGLASTLIGRDGGGERFALALAAPDGAPAATGSASLERTDSGWRIELDAPGLPRLDGGRFYEAWLRDAAGTLVPIGTFNEGDDVVLWAGVSPRDFPTLTVTVEAADGDQASSGQRVLVGTLDLPG